MSGRSLYNDAYTKIARIEPHGFMSNPPAGSIGLLFSPNGSADQAYIIGGEHPDHRPTGLPVGASAIYDMWGGIVKLITPGLVIDVGSRTATLTANGGWTINGPVTINGDVAINGNLNATGSITDGDGDGGA